MINRKLYDLLKENKTELHLEPESHPSGGVIALVYIDFASLGEFVETVKEIIGDKLFIGDGLDAPY